MNEIKILVRTQNSAKAGLDEVNKEIDKFAKTSSETFSKSFSENLARTFTTHLNEAVTRTQTDAGQVGDRIGDNIGQRVSTRIVDRIREIFRRGGSVDQNVNRAGSGGLGGNGDSNGRLRDERGRFVSSDRDRDTVHVKVDIDKQSLFERLNSLGRGFTEKISGFFNDGMKTGISGVFSGDVVSSLIKGGLVTAGVVAFGPVIGAAITAGALTALGGGAIAAGLASAIKGSPTVQSAFDGLKEKAKGIFSDFGSNFKGPLMDFVQMATQLLETMRPMIRDVGRSLGPVADDLAHGVIGFLQNVLPSIMRAIKASEPLIEVLASELPGIGDALGRFIDHLSNGAPEAAQFFNDFLNFVQLSIRALGVLVEGLTTMYEWVRYTFLTMVNMAATWAVGITSAAAIAFGWVPGLGPKLDRAAQEAKKFKDKVNGQLRGLDHDVTIDVKIRTWGLNTAVAVLDVARQLRAIGAIGRAYGGAVGQAASGGPRSNMTWVGEHGPELVDLAPGSRVWSAGDSSRMAGGQGGGGGSLSAVARVEASDGDERRLIDILTRVIRVEVFNNAGGDVQRWAGAGA